MNTREPLAHRGGGNMTRKGAARCRSCIDWPEYIFKRNIAGIPDDLFDTEGQRTMTVVLIREFGAFWRECDSFCVQDLVPPAR